MLNNKGESLKISPTAGQFIPEAVRGDSIDLERLLKAYYEWSEASGGFTSESKALLKNFSYKTADERYLKYFKDTLLRLFPDIEGELLQHLLKFSKIFYSQKGTPESYKFLFKAIWGDESLELAYPSKYILRSSDGVWGENEKIQLDMSFENIANLDLDGSLLVGVTSGARAFISDTLEVDTETSFVTYKLSNLNMDFNLGEIVEIYSDVDMNNLITQVRIVPVLAGYEIIDGGSGYVPNRDINLISHGIGEGLSITIDGVSPHDGRITSIRINNPGKNYLGVTDNADLPILNLADLYLFSVESKTRTEAKIQLKLVSNYKDNGGYIEPKSLLSDEWKLRDGEYYQEYSYVINSSLDKSTISGVVEDLLHPAGMAVFYKRRFDAANLNYKDLSGSYFTATSHFATKSDRLMRYSNYVNYNASDAFYI